MRQIARSICDISILISTTQLIIENYATFIVLLFTGYGALKKPGVDISMIDGIYEIIEFID